MGLFWDMLHRNNDDNRTKITIKKDENGAFVVVKVQPAEKDRKKNIDHNEEDN